MSTVAASPEPTAPDWRRVQRAAVIAACLGLLLCALGALLNPERLFRSYLVAFLFCLGITLGSMALVMLQHLTGGAWGLVLRRLLESAARTLPLVALLFVPIAIGLPNLYVWAHAEWHEEYDRLHGGHGFTKGDYLTPNFVLVRTAVYFAIWIVLALVLTRMSRRQDHQPDARLPRRFRLLSAPGLAIYGLTITLASIDWIMSLQPEWYSSLFGVLVGTGQVLTGFAFAVAVLLLLAPYPPLRDVLAPRHLRDLGNLLLAFVMLWAYMSFSQYLLIWSGNITEEITWYLRRGQGGWQHVILLLAVLQFALPFLLLLSRDVKRSRGTLAVVAGLVLAMRFLDLYWLVMPTFNPDGLAVHWLDLGALLMLGGAWLAWFISQLKSAPLLPQGDPYLSDLTEGPAHD